VYRVHGDVFDRSGAYYQAHEAAYAEFRARKPGSFSKRRARTAIGVEFTHNGGMDTVKNVWRYRVPFVVPALLITLVGGCAGAGVDAQPSQSPEAVCTAVGEMRDAWYGIDGATVDTFLDSILPLVHPN